MDGKTSIIKLPSVDGTDGSDGMMEIWSYADFWRLS